MIRCAMRAICSPGAFAMPAVRYTMCRTLDWSMGSVVRIRVAAIVGHDEFPVWPGLASAGVSSGLLTSGQVRARIT